jgi:hypothetical protein
MKTKLSYKEVLQSDPFADGANLDLSGFPDYSELPAPKDDPFAPRIADFSSDQLKHFAADPGRDVIEELAVRTNNPELLAQVQDEREGIEAEKFVANNPQYYQSDENAEALRDYLDEKKLAFTEENLTLAFKALSESGALEVPAGGTRELTEEQHLVLCRMCNAGRLEDALMNYLRFRIVGAVRKDPSTDPRYQDVCRDAAYFIFENSTPDFVPTKAAREFFESFISGRVVTLPILRAAHDAWRKLEAKSERGLLLESWQRPENKPADPQTIAESFDELSDEEIQRSLQASYKEHFKQVRGL